MMNKLNSKIILIIGMLIGLLACSEDLDLVSEGNSCPVVYCLLNPNDTVHYLRIAKSFQIFSNAMDSPPVSDSLIYDEDFYAYLVENDVNSGKEIFYFEPCDKTDRDSGFYHVENLGLLKVKCQIKTGTEYSVYIYSPELPKLIVGSTMVIPSFEILDPVYMPGREVTLLPDQGFDLRWIHNFKYAVYQPGVRIHYLEGDADFQVQKTVRLDLPEVFSYTEAATVVDYLNGANFYKGIIQQLSLPPPGKKRKLIGFDLEVCAGGEEMALLRQGERDENNPFSQIRSYTNFDGAQGIFSTRVFQTSHNNRFSDITENYLATSAETKQLGFLAHGEEF